MQAVNKYLALLSVFALSVFVFFLSALASLFLNLCAKVAISGAMRLEVDTQRSQQQSSDPPDCFPPPSPPSSPQPGMTPRQVLDTNRKPNARPLIFPCFFFGRPG